jgi:hypothetical protein
MELRHTIIATYPIYKIGIQAQNGEAPSSANLRLKKEITYWDEGRVRASG